MLYLKALVCKALFREFSYFAALSDNSIDISFFEWGLHDKVGSIARVLQAEIDKIDAGKDIHTSFPPYDIRFSGILIGYGLCSNGVVGLSSRHYPLVIPRAHDCITLLLGSKERYASEFQMEGNTYWLSPGWIENSRMPGEKDRTWLFNKFCKKYDAERAQIMVEINDEWMESYSRLALLEWSEFEDTGFSRSTRVIAEECAEAVGLSSDTVRGDSTLIRDMLTGKWDNDRFLVVPPGHAVKASYDAGIVSL